MTTLKRTIGLPLLLFFGLGNILGAGIYVLVGKVAGEAGLYTPVAFFVAAFVATFSAFSYSELSARFPQSAGEAVYMEEGFRLRWLSRLTGILIAFAGMVSAATISRGFHGYFSSFFDLPEVIVITGIILALGVLTIWGIRQSVGVAALLTLVEISGLLLVIVAGGDVLAEIPANLPQLTPAMSVSAWNGILLGAFLAFFAFIGFEDMVNIAEEVKNPERTMPAGILLALVIATIIYGLVALVSVMAVESQVLASSNAPLATVLASVSSINPAVISIIGMFAIVNGALIQMVMASRIFYGMANRGWIWPALATVNHITRTPIHATVLVIAIILGLALWLPLEHLARGTSFLVLIVFALVNLALYRIKRKEPAPQGIINVPVWVPVTGFILSTGLVLFQLAA